MDKKSFYPVIMTDSVKECADFFIENFGFKITFEDDWYVSLVDDNQYELAFLDFAHQTIPEGFNSKGAGILLNIEVNNVDEVYSKLSERLEDRIVLDIKTEDFGQRHFIVEAPGKILVDIIEVIEPSEEFADKYE